MVSRLGENLQFMLLDIQAICATLQNLHNISTKWKTLCEISHTPQSQGQQIYQGEVNPGPPCLFHFNKEIFCFFSKPPFLVASLPPRSLLDMAFFISHPV